MLDELVLCFVTLGFALISILFKIFCDTRV